MRVGSDLEHKYECEGGMLAADCSAGQYRYGILTLPSPILALLWGSIVPIRHNNFNLIFGIFMS